MAQNELKDIVQRMIDAGESEENIATVIQGYKPPTVPEHPVAKSAPGFSFNKAMTPEQRTASGFNFNQAITPQPVMPSTGQAIPADLPSQAELAQLRSNTANRPNMTYLEGSGYDTDALRGQLNSLFDWKTGLQGGLGAIRGGTTDIFQRTIPDLFNRVISPVESPYVAPNESFGSFTNRVLKDPALSSGNEMAQVQDMIERAGSEPHEFGRFVGQTTIQPLVTHRTAAGTPSATRAVGQSMGRTGYRMVRDRPFQKSAPAIVGAASGITGTGLGYMFGGPTGAAFGGVPAGPLGYGLGFGLRPMIGRMEQRMGHRLMRAGLNTKRFGDWMEDPWIPQFVKERRIPFTNIHGARSAEGIVDPDIPYGPFQRYPEGEIIPEDLPIGLPPATTRFQEASYPAPAPPSQLPPGRIKVRTQLPEGKGDWINMEPPTQFDPMSPSPMHGTTMPMQSRPLPPDPILTQIIRKPSTKVTQQMKERGYSLLHTNKDTGAQTWVKRRDVNAPNTPPVGSVLDRRTVPSPSGKMGDQLKKDGYVKESTAKGKETWVKKQK